jgi:hypothetical protein
MLRKIALFILPLIAIGGWFWHRASLEKLYLKTETMVLKIDPKSFQKKLNASPLWMKEQIDGDFKETSNISKEKVDATYSQIQKILPPSASSYVVRYRIVDGRLYRYFPKHEPISIPDNSTEIALKTLLRLIKFNDLDWIVSFFDAAPIYNTPDIHLTPSRDLQAPVLVPAKQPELPYCVLIPDGRSIGDWWFGNIKHILQAKRTSPSWEQKKNMAIWRGGMTNPIRIELCRVSNLHPDLIDAKINYFSKLSEREWLEQLGVFQEGRLEWKDFLEYKYLPAADGVMCAAPAVQWRLLSGSAMLMQEMCGIQWFYRAIQPYIHYIPVKADFSDLVEKLVWAQSHDAECKKIAEASSDFAMKNLMYDDVLLYVGLVLKKYSSLQVLNREELKNEIRNDPRWIDITNRAPIRKQAEIAKGEGYMPGPSPY